MKILVPCPQCGGSGFIKTKNGTKKCPYPGCKDGMIEHILDGEKDG